MSKIECIEHNGEKIYLKKDWLGYRIVHPIKNLDGSYNKVNLIFGGWRNIINLIIISLLISGMFWYINNEIKDYKGYCEEISTDPINFCNDLFLKGNNQYQEINYTQIYIDYED